MRKFILPFFYGLFLAFFAGNTSATNDQKDIIIEKMMPKICLWIRDTLVFEYMRSERDTELPPKELVDFFDACVSRLSETLQKRCKEELSISELTELLDFFLSKEWAQRREMIEQIPLIFKKIIAHGVSKYTLNPFSKDVSDSYYQLVKEYLKEKGMEANASLMFDHSIKLNPSLIKGLNEDQIKVKRLAFIESMYRMFAKEYSKFLDEKSFKRCADFETSSAMKKLQGIADEAAEELADIIEQESTEMKEDASDDSNE